jgi:hypothetical protein
MVNDYSMPTADLVLRETRNSPVSNEKRSEYKFDTLSDNENRFITMHHLFVFVFLVLAVLTSISVATNITQVSIWSQVDLCAQSCASSASSYFSSSLGCSGDDLYASCLCPSLTFLRDAAHSCASVSCTAFASYAVDAERARAIVSQLCWSNIADAPATVSATGQYSTLRSPVALLILTDRSINHEHTSIHLTYFDVGLFTANSFSHNFPRGIDISLLGVAATCNEHFRRKLNVLILLNIIEHVEFLEFLESHKLANSGCWESYSNREDAKTHSGHGRRFTGTCNVTFCSYALQTLEDAPWPIEHTE